MAGGLSFYFYREVDSRRQDAAADNQDGWAAWLTFAVGGGGFVDKTPNLSQWEVGAGAVIEIANFNVSGDSVWSVFNADQQAEQYICSAFAPEGSIKAGRLYGIFCDNRIPFLDRQPTNNDTAAAWPAAYRLYDAPSQLGGIPTAAARTLGGNMPYPDGGYGLAVFSCWYEERDGQSWLYMLVGYEPSRSVGIQHSSDADGLSLLDKLKRAPLVEDGVKWPSGYAQASGRWDNSTNGVPEDGRWVCRVNLDAGGTTADVEVVSQIPTTGTVTQAGFMLWWNAGLSYVSASNGTLFGATTAVRAVVKAGGVVVAETPYMVMEVPGFDNPLIHFPDQITVSMGIRFVPPNSGLKRLPRLPEQNPEFIQYPWQDGSSDGVPTYEMSSADPEDWAAGVTVEFETLGEDGRVRFPCASLEEPHPSSGTHTVTSHGVIASHGIAVGGLDGLPWKIGIADNEEDFFMTVRHNLTGADQFGFPTWGRVLLPDGNARVAEFSGDWSMPINTRRTVNLQPLPNNKGYVALEWAAEHYGENGYWPSAGFDIGESLYAETTSTGSVLMDDENDQHTPQYHFGEMRLVYYNRDFQLTGYEDVVFPAGTHWTGNLMPSQRGAYDVLGEFGAEGSTVGSSMLVTAWADTTMVVLRADTSDVGVGRWHYYTGPPIGFPGEPAGTHREYPKNPWVHTTPTNTFLGGTYLAQAVSYQLDVSGPVPVAGEVKQRVDNSDLEFPWPVHQPFRGGYWVNPGPFLPDDDGGPDIGPFSIYVTPRVPRKKPFAFDEPNCRCPVQEPDTDASAIVDLCREFPRQFTNKIGNSQQRPMPILTIRWNDDAAPVNYIDRPESSIDSKIKRLLDLQNYGIGAATVLEWGNVTWELGEGAVGKADAATVVLSGRLVYDKLTAEMGQNTVADLSVVYDEGDTARFSDRAVYFSGRLVAPITYDIGNDTTTITIESVLGNLKRTVGKLADVETFPSIREAYADRALPIVWGCARRVEAILVDQPWETQSLFDEPSGNTVIEITDHPDDMGVISGDTYAAFYGSFRVGGFFTQSSDKINTPSTFTITEVQDAVFATGAIAYMAPKGATFEISNRYVVLNMDDMHPGGIDWVDVLVSGQNFGVFHTSSLGFGYQVYVIGAVEYHQPYRNHVRITLTADTTLFTAGDAIEFIDPAAIRPLLQAGTGLTERGDSASWTYVANMLPSEKVVRVEGFGITLDDEGFDVEGFIPIGRQISPTDAGDAPSYQFDEDTFTIDLSDSTWFASLGHNVTTVNFSQRPRRMHKRLRSDRIWVTLQGTKHDGSFTSNPARVIQEYLESPHLVALDAAQVDTDSFDAAALVMSGYRVGFAQIESQDAWEYLSRIANQCHSVIQVDAGVVRLVVLRNSVGTQALSINEDYLMDNAITIESSPMDDVASHVYTTYRRTWDDQEEAFETASHELANVTTTIGRNVQELELDLYPCRKVVDAEAKFWLNRWGVIYQDITVEMGIEGLCLRPGDWLHVDFAEPDATLVDEVMEVQTVTFTPGGVDDPPTCQVTGRSRLHEFD